MLQYLGTTEHYGSPPAPVCRGGFDNGQRTLPDRATPLALLARSTAAEHETVTRADELHQRLAWLERRMTTLVEADPAANGQTFRGVYMSFDQARAALRGPVGVGAGVGVGVGVEDSPPLGPWMQGFAGRAGLDRHDIDVLTVALAPDVDARWPRLFGFVHDDLTRTRASIALSCNLAGLDLGHMDVRRRFISGGLLQAALVAVEGDGPFTGRTLTVPDHVLDVLLGGDGLEPAIADVAVPVVPVHHDDVERIAVAIASGRAVHVTGPADAAAEQVAAAACASLGRTALIADPGGRDDTAVTLAALSRHRALTGDTVIVAGADRLAEHSAAALERWSSMEPATITTGQEAWSPSTATAEPVHIAIGPLGAGEQHRQWRAALEQVGVDEAVLDRLVDSFRLTPVQIRRAAASIAAGDGADFTHLSAAARRQSSARIGRMARRLEPRARWEDLVLPGPVAVLLHDLARRVRHHDRVMNAWGMARGWRRAGLAALFAGPSGTGKTMAAEVIAHSLGLDLHVVDLASVIDKYIGETEKRLEVIFTAAEQTNTVLLFDEADAIFGKRSEVKDARDRYANIEVAYLLQRIERFTGLAILTTNLGANLDEAFTRRLDVVVDFPRPDVVARRRLWCKELRAPLPVDGVDVEFCAAAFELTGGEIRNAVLTAAYLAADANAAVTMTTVIHAVQREFHKMGRLCIPAEFGAYAHLLSDDEAEPRSGIAVH